MALECVELALITLLLDSDVEDSDTQKLCSTSRTSLCGHNQDQNLSGQSATWTET